MLVSLNVRELQLAIQIKDLLYKHYLFAYTAVKYAFSLLSSSPRHLQNWNLRMRPGKKI